MDLHAYASDLARRARNAARDLAAVKTAQKNRWLEMTATALVDRTDEILQANQSDLTAVTARELNAAQIDRLRLTADRLKASAQGLREIAVLPDPVGLILDSTIRPNGMEVHKVSVPLGVIFFLYESRPNVTVDAAALCVKSGNAVILRGGKEAIASNTALHRVLQDCLKQAELPVDGVQLVTKTDRDVVGHLLKMDSLIDLVIPRGGESLIRRVSDEATMPVLKHYKGNCHVYVDTHADLDMAERIVVNAKCQRPGVCNAAESLLVHTDIAKSFLPKVAAALQSRGVELRGCETTRNFVNVTPASEEDFAAEYLDLILSIKVVADVDEAIRHIDHYGSRHTETIVTKDAAAASKFTAEVDSSAVLVNASTRLNDGFELGLGAEIGISTDKFHARGPCGLQELCSYKYIVYGTGQVRD